MLPKSVCDAANFRGRASCWHNLCSVSRKMCRVPAPADRLNLLEVRGVDDKHSGAELARLRHGT